MEILPEPGLTEHGELVVKVTEHWIVAVTPMIVNDRIQIASYEEFGKTFTAAWCYSRPEGTPPFRGYFTSQALAVAEAWDPETEVEPPDYTKCAYDARKGSLL